MLSMTRAESTIDDDQKRRMLFLFPLMYRPTKVNVTKRFTHFSNWSTGHIFALSGERQKALPIEAFEFHSEGLAGGTFRRLMLSAWIHIVVPCSLLVRQGKVDVIVAYDPFRSGVAALILKFVFQTKAIVELNGDYHTTASTRDGVRGKFMQMLLHAVLKRADAIKCVNLHQEAFCRAHFPGKAIYRFPDFAATDYFGGLPCVRGDYLLSVGHPFKLKGMDTLIAAFLQIAERHQHVHLRIMGFCHENELARFRELARDHPRISFVRPGWIEEVGEQMRGCLALVNASRTDAMPRVHFEAMACAKPIVATRTNGASEAIVHGETGLLCAIDDVGDLASRLDELVSDSARSIRMGEAGRARLQSLFSEEHYAASFRRMVEEVAQRVEAICIRSASTLFTWDA